MKRMLALLLCALLGVLPALAEDITVTDDEDSMSMKSLGSMGGEVTGEPDTPALKNPKDRYEVYVDATDGSEYMMYVMLDSANDEASNIAEHGALYITENQMLDASGKPTAHIDICLQDTPYGTVMISSTKFLWMTFTNYFIGTHAWSYDGETASPTDTLTQDDYDYYIESYHFPYGSLETMNGVRQDENGYTYFLIKSSDEMTFEFVTGADMRIVQLRVYTPNDDGELALSSTVDYDVGPAQEIPQAVLDAMGEVLTPLPDPTPVPEDYDESIEDNPLINLFKNLIEEEPEP